MEQKTIVAIEIGSSKVKGAVGIFDETDRVLTVIAVEEETSIPDLVRYGAISNVEEVARMTARVIQRLDARVAPRRIAQVYVGLGGRSLCSKPHDVSRSFGKDLEITEDTLRALLADARLVPFHDRELFDVVPREYVVDKVRVQHPKGTVGSSIRMSANLITCRPATRRNLDMLFSDKLHLTIGGYEVRQLAVADLVLTAEERRLGCMLVDFGAETTTVSIYSHGNLQYLATLPLGSRNITRDITRLNYVEEKAEEIKRNVGNAAINASLNASPSMNGVDYTAVNNYVSARVGEIIANIREQLKLAQLKAEDLPAGIVVVGRGALLRGFNERLASTLGMKIRSGAIVSPDIRISCGGVQASDAVDVIAILNSAAQHGAGECLTDPPVVDEEPVQEPVGKTDEEPEPVVEPIVEPKDSWWKSKLDGIKRATIKLVSENEDDDDYVDD